MCGWHPYLTHRQARVWAHWLKQEQYTPTRADYYAMQTAAEVRVIRYGLAGVQQDVTLDQMMLRKKDPAPQVAGGAPPWQHSKAAWLAWHGRAADGTPRQPKGGKRGD